MTRMFAASILATFCVVSAAGELPTKSIQIIKNTDHRTKVRLQQGELLLIQIENGSGDFADDLDVQTNKTPMKLMNSAMQRTINDEGQLSVGSSPIVLLFEATKAGSGELIIVLNRRLGTETFKLKVDVQGEPSKSALRM